jgi:hypothetical protein
MRAVVQTAQQLIQKHAMRHQWEQRQAWEGRNPFLFFPKPNGVQLGGQPKQSQLASHLPFSEPKYFVKLCRSKSHFARLLQGVQEFALHPLFPTYDQPLLPCGGTWPGWTLGCHGGWKMQSALILPKAKLALFLPGRCPPGPKSGPGRRIVLGVNFSNSLKTFGILMAKHFGGKFHLWFAFSDLPFCGNKTQAKQDFGE